MSEMSKNRAKNTLSIHPLVLLSLSDHAVNLSNDSTPHSSKSPCLGLLFGRDGDNDGDNTATDCLPFYPKLAEGGNDTGDAMDLGGGEGEEEEMRKMGERLKEYRELHKGVFPNTGEVIGIYYVSPTPTPTLPPLISTVFTTCATIFPSCLSLLLVDSITGSYTVLRQATKLGGEKSFKEAECRVQVTSISRTVIESVVEGIDGAGGKENLKNAVEDLDGKLKVMEEYLMGGGRDYETVRRIKGIVDSMNMKQVHPDDDGVGVEEEEKGVKALRWLAETTKGTEKRRERLAHLF